MRGRFVAGLLLAGLAMPWSSAGVLLQERDAGDWRVSEWLNADPGTLASHRGQVVLIEFFQLWCPACREFSTPLFRRWHERFGYRSDVLVVSIHSVFEGHEEQTPEALREYVRRRGIRHPVGIDAYDSDPASPLTMQLYHAEGTPHVAIVDKAGKLRFSHFGEFDPAPIEAFIERLLGEKGEGTTTTVSTAPSRPARPTSKGRPRPTAQEPAAPNPSGQYDMMVQQDVKSCGEPDPATQLAVRVDARDDKLVLRFSGDVIGVSDLTADFDPRSGRFSGQYRQDAPEEGGMSLQVDVQGTVHADSEPPEIELAYSLSRQGGDGSSDCVIEGSASGTKIGR